MGPGELQQRDRDGVAPGRKGISCFLYRPDKTPLVADFLEFLHWGLGLLYPFYMPMAMPSTAKLHENNVSVNKRHKNIVFFVAYCYQFSGE